VSVSAKKLASILPSISETKDLSLRVDTNLSGEFNGLAASFNSFLAELK